MQMLNSIYGKAHFNELGKTAQHDIIYLLEVKI